MPSETVYAFIDYENIRKAFPDFVEYVGIVDVIHAFESLGKELGTLRGMTFFGDWTRRQRDAHEIENRGYRADNVLSTRYSQGKDRSDTRMSFVMYDMARERSDITAFIVGAGDADYKEAILRSKELGKKIYILCFGSTISREYFTMTHGVFPLENRMSLIPKQQLPLPFSGRLESVSPSDRVGIAINRIDSLEKTLPNVVRNYVVRQILLPMSVFGETPREVHQFVEELINEGILLEDDIDNPKIPGKTVKRLKLNRDNTTVASLLSAGGGTP